MQPGIQQSDAVLHAQAETSTVPRAVGESSSIQWASGSSSQGEIVSINDRRVRVSGETSLYSQCRQWIQNNANAPATLSAQETAVKMPAIEGSTDDVAPVAVDVDMAAHYSVDTSIEAHIQRWKTVKNQMQQRADTTRKPYEERLVKYIRNQA